MYPKVLLYLEKKNLQVANMSKPDFEKLLNFSIGKDRITNRSTYSDYLSRKPGFFNGKFRKSDNKSRQKQKSAGFAVFFSFFVSTITLSL